jgi:hypothetical protein
MRTDQLNRSNRRNLAQLPISPPQIPLDMIWDRTRTAVVGSPDFWVVTPNSFLGEHEGSGGARKNLLSSRESNPNPLGIRP